MSATQAIDAVTQLAERANDQQELIGDLAAGITDVRTLDGGQRVRITLDVSSLVALRLSQHTGVAIQQ